MKEGFQGPGLTKNGACDENLRSFFFLLSLSNELTNSKLSIQFIISETHRRS